MSYEMIQAVITEALVRVQGRRNQLVEDSTVAVLSDLEENGYTVVPTSEVDKPETEPAPTYEERVAALEKAKQVLGATTGGIGGVSRQMHDYLTVAAWLLAEYDPATGQGTE